MPDEKPTYLGAVADRIRDLTGGKKKPPAPRKATPPRPSAPAQKRDDSIARGMNALLHRRAQIDSSVEDAELGRRRTNQSTDSNN